MSFILQTCTYFVSFIFKNLRKMDYKQYILLGIYRKILLRDIQENILNFGKAKCFSYQDKTIIDQTSSRNSEINPT